MYTLSFVNQKGGVGKTTVAMNTAVRLRMAGARVLLVDMDPQGNLSYLAGVNRPRHSVLDVLTGTVSPQEAIIQTPECDILPAGANLSLLERKLTGKEAGLRLKTALDSCRETYHYVVIDSPPALGLLMLNVLSASDSVVIPALADVFSLQGIGQLYSTIQAVKQTTNPRLGIDGILLSREEESTQLIQDVEETLHAAAQKMGTEVFETFIRRSPLVCQAQADRKSIFLYAPESGQAGDYSRFTLEYLKRLRLRLCR